MDKHRNTNKARQETTDMRAREAIRYLEGPAGLPVDSFGGGGEGRMAWVRFRDDVTEHDIRRFMAAHTEPDKAFQAYGSFGRAFEDRPELGASRESWGLCYQAKSWGAALRDIRLWHLDAVTGTVNRDMDALFHADGHAMHLYLAGKSDGDGSSLDNVRLELPTGQVVKIAWTKTEHGSLDGSFWKRCEGLSFQSDIFDAEGFLLPKGSKISPESPDLEEGISLSVLLISDAGGNTWQAENLPIRLDCHTERKDA